MLHGSATGGYYQCHIYYQDFKNKKLSAFDQEAAELRLKPYTGIADVPNWNWKECESNDDYRHELLNKKEYESTIDMIRDYHQWFNLAYFTMYVSISCILYLCCVSVVILL